MLIIERYLKTLLPVAALLLAVTANAKEINGFVLDDALIPAAQIYSGGPEKDGIPAIDRPVFVAVADAGFMKDDDRVLAITVDGVSRAYPVKILNWHEIVNDSIGNRFFTITYCPLCGSGVAFDREVNGQVLSFGVSGLLYNSDVLLYDRETQSLWSQLMSSAVSGRQKGSHLTMLPLIHTTWEDWKVQQPATTVLSRQTGYRRSYDKDPYEGYAQSRQLYFPVFNRAPATYHPKERVLGVTVGKLHKAYPFIELNKYGKHSFEDSLAGKTFTVHWNKQQQSGYLADSEGELLPAVQSYWFAWYAFNPETEVFSAGRQLKR